jgi:hypothetical protein
VALCAACPTSGAPWHPTIGLRETTIQDDELIRCHATTFYRTKKALWTCTTTLRRSWTCTAWSSLELLQCAHQPQRHDLSVNDCEGSSYYRRIARVTPIYGTPFTVFHRASPSLLSTAMGAAASPADTTNAEHSAILTRAPVGAVA